MSQTEKIEKQREQLDSLMKLLNITTTQPSVSLSSEEIKEQRRKLNTIIDEYSASLSVDKLREFTKRKDKSISIRK